MLIHNYDNDVEKSVFEQICDTEMENYILKMGSMISLIFGKTVSIVFVFNYLLNNIESRNIFCKMLDCDWKELAIFMSKRYPILSKSKKIQQEELEMDG